MRYFIDTPVYGDAFMCARVDGDVVETRTYDEDSWSVFVEMTLPELEHMAEFGFLKELDEDPFKEQDCPVDAN